MWLPGQDTTKRGRLPDSVAASDLAEEEIADWQDRLRDTASRRPLSRKRLRRLIAEANMHLPGRQIDPERIRRDLVRLSAWERETGDGAADIVRAA